MVQEEHNYRAYLLRMWRDRGDNQGQGDETGAWRASLQSPHSGESIGFADLDELFAYLRNQTISDREASEDQGRLGR